MSNQKENIELLKKLRDTLPYGDERTRMSVIIVNYMGMELKLEELNNSVDSEVMEALERLNHALCTPEVNFKSTNELYNTIKNYIISTQQHKKELEELKKTNSLVKENIDNIFSRMLTYDDVSDLTLSFVEDIQNELDKLLGGQR